MKILEADSTLSIDIKDKELVTLAQFFAPGEIIGLADPFEEYSDEEKDEQINECRDLLIDSGYLEKDENDNWRMDEFLAAFVYSCLYSQNMMILHNEVTLKPYYFYFLQNWILSRTDMGDEMRLTLYKSIDELMGFISEIMKFPNTKRSVNHDVVKINEREWERIKTNYFKGETGSSLEALTHLFPEYNDSILLPSILLEPDQDFWIRVVLNCNDDVNKALRNFRFFGNENALFISEYLQDDEPENNSITISQVDNETLTRRIKYLIPAI